MGTNNIDLQEGVVKTADWYKNNINESQLADLEVKLMEKMSEIVEVTVVTPVHNEGASIRTTLEEFFKYYENSIFEIKFIVSEDGSVDNSVNEIIGVGESYPVKLISEPIRKRLFKGSNRRIK